MNCPRCGAECERDTVDVGVGEIPSGPWGCFECHWAETFEDDTERTAPAPEKESK